MIDPVAATMLALTSHSPTAVGLIFLAGFMTSVGPCIAPRYIAIAAIVNGAARPLLSTGMFVLGLISAFVALGYVAGLLGALWSMSTPIYLVLAVGLIVGGGIALVRAVPPGHGGQRCAHDHRSTNQPRSLGAIFLLGAASALVISPCCTPIVAAVVAASAASGKPLIGTVLLMSFATGHALPLLFAGKIGSLVGPIFARRIPSQASAIVCAVLMLALGMYYAVLA